MSLFRSSKKRPSAPYLFDGPHWRVQPVASLDVFFANVLLLVPPGHVLHLAAGSPHGEVRGFIKEHALQDQAEPPLPREFWNAPALRLEPATVGRLAHLVSREPDPVLAVHLGVHAGGAAVLEWYDLPSDPLSVAVSIPEPRVAKFASACGVPYDRR